MNINDDINNVLLKIGLEDYEIENVLSRNKYLKVSIAEDVLDIVKYLYTDCKLEMKDIKKLVLKNPYILSESLTRINALEKIYKTIGIEKERYKELINNFDKALSLNPKELAEVVNDFQKNGCDFEQISDIIIKNPYLIIKI